MVQHKDWVYSEAVDEFTDEKKIVALTKAVDGGDGTLAVTCFPGNSFQFVVDLGLYVGWDILMDSEEYVRYRVDDGAVKEVSLPNNGTKIFYNGHDSGIVHDMANGKDRIVIEVTNYNFEKERAIFSLEGMGQSAKRVIDFCAE